MDAAQRPRLVPHVAPFAPWGAALGGLADDYRSSALDISYAGGHATLGPWGRRLAQTSQAWLFPSSRIDGPQLYGWFKARDRIHRRMEELAECKIPSWHFHDLRRTFRSHARRLGIDRDIAELMLNHRRKGIEGICDRNEQLELRAAGLAAWKAFLMETANRRAWLGSLAART